MNTLAMGVLVLVSIGACAGSVAQETDASATAVAPPPPACATDAAPYRDFDFWIGDWDVFDTADNVAGTNSISRRENGCLLVEEWTGATGGSGTSLNFVDPATGKWRQVWMSQGALIDYTGELDDAGVMRLEGEITYNRTGQSLPFRGSWALNADASVTQGFTQYNPETDAWDPWFTGIYKRQSKPDD